jgi:hypothetical protein
MDEDAVISIVVLCCVLVVGILSIAYAWTRTEENGFYETV